MNYKEAVLAISWLFFFTDILSGPTALIGCISSYPYSYLRLAEFFFDDSVGRVTFLGITTTGLLVFVVLTILSLVAFIKWRTEEQ